MVDITSYEFVTANDNPKRDPKEWTFQSKYGNSWILLDERYDINAPVSSPPTRPRPPARRKVGNPSHPSPNTYPSPNPPSRRKMGFDLSGCAP